MNNQLSHYISIEPDFFQELEGEFGVKITGKLVNFLRTVEMIRPDRFMTSEMRWCGVGRKKLDREKFFRAFLLKAEFNLPTTKVLIESLRTNTSWRLLCGWEYSSRIPSEATFSRAFSEFAKIELPSAIHEEIVVENCHDELIGHASKDSTAIEVREKPCRRKKRTCKMKKKRGRKARPKKLHCKRKRKKKSGPVALHCSHSGICLKIWRICRRDATNAARKTAKATRTGGSDTNYTWMFPTAAFRCLPF